MDDSSLPAFCNFLLFDCELPGLLKDNDSISALVKQPLLVDDDSCIDLRLPLFFAVQSGKIDKVKLLLDHGADIYHTRPWGLPALSLAVYSGQHSFVKTLIEELSNLDLNRVDSADCIEKYFYSAAPEHIKRMWVAKNHSVTQNFGQFKHPLEIAGGDLKMVQILCMSGGCRASGRVLRKAIDHPQVLECLIDVAEDLNEIYQGKTILDLCFNRIILSSASLLPCVYALFARGARLASVYSLLKPGKDVMGRPGHSRLNHLRWLALSTPYSCLFVRNGDLTFKEFIVDFCLALRDEQTVLCNGQKRLIEEAFGVEITDRETYTASLIRNFLHHLSVCNLGRLPFHAKELKYIFEEDLAIFPEQTETELSLLTNLLCGPLSLKDTCRILIIMRGLTVTSLRKDYNLDERLCKFIYKI